MNEGVCAIKRCSREVPQGSAIQFTIRFSNGKTRVVRVCYRCWDRHGEDTPWRIESHVKPRRRNE
jgi:hypothetical protein